MLNVIMTNSLLSSDVKLNSSSLELREYIALNTKAFYLSNETFWQRFRNIIDFAFLFTNLCRSVNDLLLNK